MKLLSGASSMQVETGDSCQVFLCYRQEDGDELASWLFETLQGTSLPGNPEQPKGEVVSIYFDRTAPAIGDWRSMHTPSLETAKAMLIVCTPKANQIKGKDDWVHREVNWWLQNRKCAPILVDPGSDGKWIPDRIKARWPDAQRVNIDLGKYNKMDSEAKNRFRNQIVVQITQGISAGASKVVFEEWERNRRRIRTIKVFSIGLALALLLGGGAWVRALKNARRADVNAAATFTSGANTRLSRSESFGAMHEFAAAIYKVKDQESEFRLILSSLRSAQLAIPQLLAIIPHDVWVAAAMLSSDGSRLLTTDSNGRVQLWSVELLINGLPHLPATLEDGTDGSFPVGAQFSGNEHIVVTAHSKNSLRILDAATLGVLSTISVSGDVGDGHIAVTFEGDKVGFVAIGSRSADVWEARSGRHLHTLSLVDLLQETKGQITALLFDHSGKYIATPTSTGLTVVWDARTGGKISIRENSNSVWSAKVSSAAFNSDSGQIVTAGISGEISLWSFLWNTEHAETFAGFGSQVDFVTFDSANRRFLALSKKESPRIYTLLSPPSSGLVLHINVEGSERSGEEFPTRGMFAYDGNRVITWQENKVTFWDSTTGRAIWNIQGHVGDKFEAHITDASVSSESGIVATASGDKTVRLWRVPTVIDSAPATAKGVALESRALIGSQKTLGSDGSAGDADLAKIYPRHARLWVEVYTGTMFSPERPGGVRGLTETEWKSRSTELRRATQAARPR
jgi:WD40 repeat protein